jgi:transcriptional regulator with XRE-family HTH domain
MEQETERILENIRARRVEKKMSIVSLATESGISHSHLYYIENKKVIPSIDVLVKIAKSLKVNVEDFLK